MTLAQVYQLAGNNDGEWNSSEKLVDNNTSDCPPSAGSLADNSAGKRPFETIARIKQCGGVGTARFESERNCHLVSGFAFSGWTITVWAFCSSAITRADPLIIFV